MVVRLLLFAIFYKGEIGMSNENIGKVENEIVDITKDINSIMTEQVTESTMYMKLATIDKCLRILAKEIDKIKNN